MWATSDDGLSFTKQGIAVDSRDATLNYQLDGPDIVLWDDGDYRIFATTYTGVYEFTFDGTAFTNPTLALLPVKPNKPTWASAERLQGTQRSQNWGHLVYVLWQNHWHRIRHIKIDHTPTTLLFIDYTEYRMFKYV